MKPMKSFKSEKDHFSEKYINVLSSSKFHANWLDRENLVLILVRDV